MQSERDPDALREAAKARAERAIAAARSELVALSHSIHGTPEVAWEERHAAAAVATTLLGADFNVEVGAYSVETALEATYGAGDLRVAVCAEYDALPEIGHGCGHNVIAAAAVGAALGLAAVAAEAGLSVKLLGTPAEERGGGKIALLAAGAWEDADFSIMVHGVTGADYAAAAYASTAVDRFSVTFRGRSAHAAAAPEKSLNAGAASTLALMAIGLVRQQLPRNVSVNAIVAHGGDTTNVIPDRAILHVELRSDQLDVLRDLKGRTLACFEGAALALGCSWDWSPTEPPYAAMKQDPELAELWDKNLGARGRTLNSHQTSLSGASTDMGNVSQVVPSLHPAIAFLGEVGDAHSSEFAKAAAGDAASDAIIDAATAMAWTVLDVATTPTLRAAFARRRSERAPGSTREPFST